MRNNHEIVQELKEEEKQGRLFSSSKESSKNNTSDQNLEHTCFKNFFENAPLYEYMVSPEGTILEINKTALTNLGYKKEELLGKHLTAIYAPESHEKMKTLLPKWKETGEIDNEEMVIETKQGEKRRVLLSASSVRGTDGAILYFISILKDVTEINKIYDELNKNLWLQNVKLQKLNETKKTFLKTTSHELRTPITSIKGYVQMLMKKTLGEINEDQRKSLDVILRNTNRLDQVIQNILDASSLESGIMKFIPRKVNPRALVEEITKTMEPFANKKEMTINVNLEKDLPDLMIDGERIKQVLMNLVDNAIKFSPDGSTINIKTRKEKEDVLFEVQDFGQGIPKDKQGMIFDAFYQADSGDDRLFGGVGLSLALSKGIVGLHGGNIWFESTEGTGSTFLFTLPIQSISDMDNTDLMEELPSENTSAESVGLAVNSVTLNTTDEDASGSITEHEKITATPKENEERYQALFNSSFELVYLHDLKGNFIDANPTALKLLGYSKEELGSLNFSSLLDSGQIWKAMKALNEIKKHGRQKEPTEYRLKMKNGTFIDVETTAEIVYRDGKPYAIQGIARNITEQKQAKQILKESEEKYRTLFETTPDLIVETDEKGILLAVNPAIADHFGTPVEKLIGKNIFDILPKEVMKERAKIARKALKDGEIQINEDENAGRHFHNVYVPIIRPDGRKTLQLVARDITATKKAEEALIEGQEKYRLIAENTNDLIIITNFNKTFRYVSPSIKSLGYTPDELVGQDSFLLLHPEDKISITSMLKQLVIGMYKPGTSSLFEYRLRDKSGVYHIYEATAKLVKDESGKHAILSISRDITERKKTEDALRESEEKFRLLFNDSPLGIALVDPEGIIIEVNNRLLQMLSIKKEEFIGRNFVQLTSAYGLNAQEQTSDFKNRITGEPSKREITFLSKDNKKVTITVQSSIIKSSDKIIGVLFILEDITELKQAAEELRESETLLNDVGEMAHVGGWDLDTETKAVHWTKETYRIHDISMDEKFDLSKAILFFDLPDRSNLEAALQRCMETGEPFDLVLPFTSAKGRHLWTRAIGRAVKSDSVKVVKLIGTFQDITERKRAEEEREKILQWQQGVNILQQSLLAPVSLENKLKTITDSIVRLFDADFCRIWLTKPGDFCEQGCIHAEVQEGPHICRYRDRCLHLLASSGRYTHTDGKIHRRVPFGCYKIGRIASGQDRKFITNDASNDSRVHNHEWARELGLVSFAGYQLKIPGDETIGVLAFFAKHPIQPAEDTILDGLGSTVARIVQQAIEEKTVRESEERYRILFESSQDAIMTLEPPTWNFTSGNPVTIEMFKAKNKAELYSLGPGNLSPERQPDGRASTEKAKEMIETAMRDGSCFFEWTYKRINGEDFFATVLLSRVELGGKVFLQATVRDITKEKELKIMVQQKIDELERFKKLTVGREHKMIELKKEINELCKQMNQKPRYEGL